MRFFLLPISTRRTLIYCERAKPPPGQKPSIQDRIVSKANETWLSFEKADGGWKKTLTTYGNKVFRRIPYEEWGLKTIPPLSNKRKELELSQQEKVEVLFPSLFLKESKVLETCRQLAVERQQLHRKRMIYSAIGAPLTLPFALVPIIPNIPGFYLLFRAWSHWKALRGAQHLEFLVKNNLLIPSPSTAMDEVYTAGLMYPTRQMSRVARRPTREQGEAVAEIIKTQTNGGVEDVMLLQKWNGKLLAEEFKLPAMEVEIERAVEQVEQSIKAKEELIEEKKQIEKATRPEGVSELEAEEKVEAEMKSSRETSKS
ncbi:uncharacterized protein PV09_06356 [Verruconis gallopava]|uniref:Mitochondrial K+-H+ exchange-related-domain-containing protein n=1 Tax=Verruconis gallopava TaxID=253628 RepID=A0A0D2A6J6_9PEZI|nr:uncharacterized protein PV09_06356 [Verruconis gallopava]KIW02200.1 hypothetical protein PV09_06356 [Verruconis gallopava]